MDVTAHLIGYPRIGPNRELKWALERAWSGRMEADAFDARIAELRSAHIREQRDAIGSAVDDFFLYDEVLETALMLGIVPRDVAGTDAFATLTALARGTPEREAWEMTKWFDTNYHYVVPEITAAPSTLTPLPWREPLADADVAWPILGPFSLVKLSKLADGLDPVEVAHAAGDALWTWLRQQGASFQLQLDEPSLGMEMDATDRTILDAAYEGAADLGFERTPIVTVQFGRASAMALEWLGRIGLAVQVPADRVEELRGTPGWEAQPE
ncbi:MAG TPA: hypothetical protein VFW95_08020, partial [Candidatus Limnocylindria bacterium]|nr:hypothetical protein [Candidatus Limnocylindria bacterium]